MISCEPVRKDKFGEFAAGRSKLVSVHAAGQEMLMHMYVGMYVPVAGIRKSSKELLAR
jgi:hypothetical protein